MILKSQKKLEWLRKQKSQKIQLEKQNSDLMQNPSKNMFPDERVEWGKIHFNDGLQQSKKDRQIDRQIERQIDRQIFIKKDRQKNWTSLIKN